MPITAAERKYLKNKHRGGKSSAKGNLYEEYYAVYQLALLIDKYRSTPSNVHLATQVPETFVDDLLIVQEGLHKTYHQLKDVKNISWASNNLKCDFERQRDISLENGEQFALKIVYSDADSSVGAVPETISDCTTAEHFPSCPSIQSLYFSFQPFQQAVKNIATPLNSTDNDLIGISGALLGAWGMVDSQSSTSLEEILEKVYNIGKGLININTYPSSIKVSDDCSALFHQIGVQFQVSGTSLYWSYRSFSGYLPWTKEAEERIIAASPKEFKDIIDLLN